MQLLQKVKDYIREKQLLNDNQKVIVGLSGGADSMALMHILLALGYDCIAAHCNFHLRGEESDRDELFTQTYCRENNISYTSTSFDTYKYMEEKSISLEMAARELRYNWFDKISHKLNSDQIAVAHHNDDSVETVIINMTRGCGIRGLTGIPPKNEKIVRPLLCLSRKEILEYLAFHKIPFVEDSTNQQDDYTRNKIRLNILPLLEEINPSVKQSIQHMIEYLSDVENIYLKYISKAKTDIFEGGVIDIEKLGGYPEAKTILFEILHPYGFNSDIINQVFDSIDGIPGKIFLSKEYRLIKDRRKFILEKTDSTKTKTSFQIDEGKYFTEQPLKLKTESLFNDEDFRLEKNKKILYADKSKITFPLQIRRWKQGDSFIPLGMKGKKKISDYFTDNKFNIIQKENTWLLCTSSDEIIWIIGERPDNRFKITGATTEILKIELIGS